MNSNKTRHTSRWGILAAAAVLILLLVGGTLYAQGFGRNQRHGQDRGFGRGMGQGMGPGMQGPGAMMGAGMLMMDEDIRHLMGMIRIVEGINKFELDADQVAAFLDLARECRGIREEHFAGVREQVIEGLRGQLDDAIAGRETEPGFVREIMEGFRERHEPGEMREVMGGIIERAVGVLTEEQYQMILDDTGPGPEMIRERAQEWQGREGPGRQWFQGLGDEEREMVRGRFGERIEGAREGAAKMKIMMFLMAPQSIEAMELWLDAH